MEKKCSGCGNKVFGYPDSIVLCNYCGSKIYFDNSDNAKTNSAVNSTPQQNTYNAQQQNAYSAPPPPNYAETKVVHYNVMVPPRPKHSMLFHIFLLFTTAGLGNIIYAIFKFIEQRNWDYHYRNKN